MASEHFISRLEVLYDSGDDEGTGVDGVCVTDCETQSEEDAEAATGDTETEEFSHSLSSVLLYSHLARSRNATVEHGRDPGWYEPDAVAAQREPRPNPKLKLSAPQTR
jgi:hypothetical protein